MFSEIPTPAETTPEITTQTGSTFATTSLSTTTTANSEQQQEITTFHDVEAPQLTVTPMATNTSSIGTMDDTVSIVNFLQRPVRLDYFKLDPTPAASQDDVSEWTTLKPIVTTEPQRPIRSYSLPQDVLNLGGKLAKTQNHQFFKADIHIKLTLNVNPFVAGRFYLTYSPYENRIVRARQQRWASRAGVTAYPGVEFDVQIGNSVEMVIPFASYKEAYVLTQEPESFVELNLYALTPIMGNKEGKGPIEFTIFAWFENIVINLPTSKIPPSLPTYQAYQPTVAVMSDKDKKRLKFARAIERMKTSDKATYDAILRRLPVEFQIQGEAKAVLINDKPTGPIGSIAGVVGDIAGWAAGSGIPVVNEIGGTVKWIADIVGGISGIFGWSRPNGMSAVVAYQNVPGKYFTHIKAEDQSVALALSQENELEKPIGIFPSAIDEMDLSYVCANPAVKAIYEWKMNGATGIKALAQQPLGLLPVGIGSFTALYTDLGKSVETLESEINPTWGKQNTAAFSGCSALFKLKFKDHFKNIVDSAVFAESAKRDFGAYNGAFCTGDGPNARTSKFCVASPAKLKATGTIGHIILDTAPCEYVSQLFQYWRATICFKICVVKTAFHTGRLEIFFDPGMYHHLNDVTITPDLSKYANIDTANNYKYILDLTNDSEVTIRVPYISEKLFLSTRGLNTGASNPSMEDVANSIIGSLVVRPLTNLMAPETVSDKVQVVVWKWAEDVVLAGPVTASNTDLAIYNVTKLDEYTPVPFDSLPYDTIRNLKYDGSFEETTVTQSVELQINLENTTGGNVITLFDSVNVDGENMKACKNAAGERLVNLRPLLRCFREWTVKSENEFVLDVQKESSKIDYLSFLSYMYRFFRGGMRYKILNKDGVVKSYLHPGTHSGTTMAPSHYTVASMNPFHEISVPYYSQYRKLPISIEDNLLNVTVKRDGEPDKSVIYRAGNDDLTFGWLMGTPQLMAGDATVKWLSYKKTGNGTLPPNPEKDWTWCGPQQGCAKGDEANENGVNSYAAQMMNPYAAPYVANRTRRDVEGYDTVDSMRVELQSGGLPQVFKENPTQLTSSYLMRGDSGVQKTDSEYLNQIIEKQLNAAMAYKKQHPEEVVYVYYARDKLYNPHVVGSYVVWNVAEDEVCFQSPVDDSYNSQTITLYERYPHLKTRRDGIAIAPSYPLQVELQMAPINRLPNREREVLERVIAGYSSAAVSLDSIIKRLQTVRLRLLRPADEFVKPEEDNIVFPAEEEATPDPRFTLKRRARSYDLSDQMNELSIDRTEKDMLLEEDCLGPIPSTIQTNCED